MSGTILFVGDSITDGERRTDPRGLGGGYVDIVATVLRERGDPARVVNAGVNGDRVEHLQRRWQEGVLDHAPSVLSVYIGVKDTWSRSTRVARRRPRCSSGDTPTSWNGRWRQACRG